MIPSTRFRFPAMALAAACGLVLAAGAAAAEADGPDRSPGAVAMTAGNEGSDKDMTPSFDSLDRNRDGMLAREELPADHHLRQKFDSIDKDSDGRLSRTEYDAYKGKKEERKDY